MCLLLSRYWSLSTGRKLVLSLRTWWLRGSSVCLQCGRPGFNPWVRQIPWRRKWQPTPVFLPGESHGRRSLVGYSPWGRKESDMTEWLHFHFLHSCLENPIDKGAWRATVHGVAKELDTTEQLTHNTHTRKRGELLNFSTRRISLFHLNFYTRSK